MEILLVAGGILILSVLAFFVGFVIGASDIEDDCCDKEYLRERVLQLGDDYARAQRELHEYRTIYGYSSSIYGYSSLTKAYKDKISALERTNSELHSDLLQAKVKYNELKKNTLAERYGAIMVYDAKSDVAPYFLDNNKHPVLLSSHGLSGGGRIFSTGAVRDTAEGKSPMGLVPMDLIKSRLAPHYGMGADKYGRDNWRLGQPKDTTYDSLLRHLTAYRYGMKDEDHLSAVIWNAFSMMHVDENLLKTNPELDFTNK